MEMLAAQAAHREVDSLSADEETIAVDEKLTDDEKRDILQKSLNMAASNGDVERVRKLVRGHARPFVDVNMPDEEGTVPLIYASCFVGPFLLFFNFLLCLVWFGGERMADGSSSRVIKRSLPRLLMLGLWLTSRIAISGVR